MRSIVDPYDDKVKGNPSGLDLLQFLQSQLQENGSSVLELTKALVMYTAMLPETYVAQVMTTAKINRRSRKPNTSTYLQHWCRSHPIR